MLRTERPDEHVRLLTMDRADRLNAMDAQLCGALHEGLADCAGDRSCRAIVINGACRGICT